MDLDLSQSYPIIASAECSPSSEAFEYNDAYDKPYLIDSYTNLPDYSLDDYINAEFFERSSTQQLPAGFTKRSQTGSISSSSAATSTAPRPNMDQWTTMSPFGGAPSFDNAFPSNLPFGTIDETFAPTYDSRVPYSPTESVCENGSRPSFTVSSPALTNNSLKREESAEPAEDEPAPKRKRGRPRLNRSDSDGAGSNGESPKCRNNRRLPHNQVERKYREGLNAELERLRRAVPTLPQRDTGDLTAPPKPSKATVLASAIDYIKHIEAERDRLAEENERLRGLRPSDVQAASKLRTMRWERTRADSANPNPLELSTL
jgi:hypothetical protein